VSCPDSHLAAGHPAACANNSGDLPGFRAISLAGVRAGVRAGDPQGAARPCRQADTGQSFKPQTVGC